MTDTICIITSVHPWNDIRIFHKEARSLAKHYSVVLVAPAPFKEKTIDNIRIISLKPWMKKWHRLLNIPKLTTDFFRFRQSIIHIHDPELLIWGLFFSFFFATRIIFDMHEDFIRDFGKAKWLPKILRPLLSSFGQLLLSLSKRQFRHFILAEDSYQKYFTENISIIHNYPDLAQIPAPLTDNEKDNQSVRIGYFGGITVKRGAALIARLAKELDQDGYAVTFELVGPIINDGSINILQETAQLLSEKSALNMHGRLDFTEGIEIIRHCHIGLAIIANHPNYIHSYPTKLFEYMALKLPVITSNFLLYEEVILKNNAGFCIDPDDFEQLKECTLTLINNKALAMTFGENGFSTVNKLYTWENEKVQLESVYEKLCN